MASIKKLDRAASIASFILATAIIILLILGDRTLPRVRDFSWKSREITGSDTAFIMTFNRAMNRSQVEQNLKISPPLPGKISWAGKRMAYTLNYPAPYDNKFTIELQNAAEDSRDRQRLMEPFKSEFRTRERRLAYIGTTGESQGRLVLTSIKQSKSEILTPAALNVTDFYPNDSGSKIYFLAAARNTDRPPVATQELYAVTTGLPNLAEDGSVRENVPSQQIERILDSAIYQNISFAVSADGKIIAIQRVNRNNVEDAGLSILATETGQTIARIPKVGDFVITPDSNGVAVAEGEGVAIRPFREEVKSIDFLPKFGTVLNFDRQANSAAMVKFNNNYTRSLFLVTNTNETKELLQTNGSIVQCEFTNNGQTLYCIVTELQKSNSPNPTPNANPDRGGNDENLTEQPFLVAIDIPSNKKYPLLLLPPQQRMHMSLAADDRAIVFDRFTGANSTPNSNQDPGTMWLLPVPEDLQKLPPKVEPVQLPIGGARPRWLP